MKQILSFTHLPDDAVVCALHRHLTSERRNCASVVALLAEFELRRLHLALGYPSTFDYCVRVLMLSEHETYNRIEVARASRKFPELLERLADGCLSLTAIRLLAPHLTPENHERLTREAEGKRIEGIKLLIARLKPQPPVPSVVRKLPEPKPVEPPLVTAPPAHKQVTETALPATNGAAAPVPLPSRRPVLAPLSKAHYKLQVTISAAASRSADGVEFHHVQPYAVGGGATVENIEMRCRAHNGFEWTQHLDRETLALVDR